MFRKSKAQSVAEYAILLAVVIGAFAAMQVYGRRTMQAKAKDGWDAFTGIEATFAPVEAGGTNASLGNLSQYEPYYLETSYERYQENVERAHMGEGKIKKEKVSDITATKAAGYTLQAGPANMTTRDTYWTGP